MSRICMNQIQPCTDCLCQVQSKMQEAQNVKRNECNQLRKSKSNVGFLQSVLFLPPSVYSVLGRRNILPQN